MGSATQQSKQRPHPRRRTIWILGGAVLAALGAALLVDRTLGSRAQAECPPRATQSSRPARPGLQRILDGLVSGPERLAPGATAYVSGPHGAWLGAAGVADASTCAPMPKDARMRLESVSKIYTAALILRLAQDRELHVGDTVARWLPGLLPAYGNRITIRQLLTMSSGLIDRNDSNGLSFEDFERTYLAHIRDAELRGQLLDFVVRGNRNPASELSEMWWIRWAAWQPLLFEPGSGEHYSNIGYDILGLIAARAGGKPLPALYREQIFEPLGLQATAYDPQGAIAGPHAHGYYIAPDGKRTDATDWHWSIGADGGIVANAGETAAFLSGLMHGKLLGRPQLEAMKGPNLWNGGDPRAYCDGQAYGWSGGGNGYKTEVWVNGNGSRVAVLLLNARHRGTAQPAADQAAHDAMASLYCAA